MRKALLPWMHLGLKKTDITFNLVQLMGPFFHLSQLLCYGLGP